MSSKVFIWKQDPSVPHQGIRSSYIHTPVKAGPSDSMLQVQIDGLAVEPDGNGDFLFCPATELAKFDAVHTFAVARQVLTMYQRALKRNNIQPEIVWQWQRSDTPLAQQATVPLTLRPRAVKYGKAACYQRSRREITFDYFPSDYGDQPLRWVYTCQSFDLVAHEMGHAILDGMKPGFLDSTDLETHALHESFADLTAIFTMLAQMDQVETIIAESKGFLAQPTFLSEVAEEFGLAADESPTGVRNAINNFVYQPDPKLAGDAHFRSQVFTGAIFEILLDIFRDELKLDEYDPAETLFRAGHYLTVAVVRAFLKSPDKNATFKDVAEAMIDFENAKKKGEPGVTRDGGWGEIMKAAFTRRRILS